MKLIYTIVITLILMFIVTFLLQNTTPVELTYYSFINVQLPVYWLIFISFSIGVLITGFMGIVERFRLSRKVSKLTRKIKVLEKNKTESSSVPVPVEENPEQQS